MTRPIIAIHAVLLRRVSLSAQQIVEGYERQLWRDGVERRGNAATSLAKAEADQDEIQAARASEAEALQARKVAQRDLHQLQLRRAAERKAASEALDEQGRNQARLGTVVARLEADVRERRFEVERIYQTKVFRYSRRLREMYAKMRRRTLGDRTGDACRSRVARVRRRIVRTLGGHLRHFDRRRVPRHLPSADRLCSLIPPSSPYSSRSTTRPRRTCGRRSIRCVASSSPTGSCASPTIAPPMSGRRPSSMNTRKPTSASRSSVGRKTGTSRLLPTRRWRLPPGRGWSFSIMTTNWRNKLWP